MIMASCSVCEDFFYDQLNQNESNTGKMKKLNLVLSIYYSIMSLIGTFTVILKKMKYVYNIYYIYIYTQYLY